MVKEYLGRSLSGIVLGLILLFGSTISQGQHVSFSPAQLPGLPEGSVIGEMCQDKNGFIWLASLSNGLFKYDGEKVTTFENNENDTNPEITNRLECIFADSNGYIWIGSFENGLYRLNPETGSYTWYQHSNANPASIRSDSIRAIIESHDGIIWIGTSRGLDSFDPKTGEFSHIDNTSEEGLNLSKEHVRALYEDKAGTIWIGCGSPFPADDIRKKSGGLFKLDRKTGVITHYIHKDGDEHSLMDNRVRAIFEDSRGVFWVGTLGEGLHIMDRDKGTFQRYLYDPENPQKLSRPPVNNKFNYADDHITFINEDAEGCIWIGTFCNGINRYNPKTNTVEYFGTSATGTGKIDQDDFWKCIKTKDNLLWASVWNAGNISLYKISITTNKINHSFTGIPVRDFEQDKDGNILLATDEGLFMKKAENDYEHFLTDKDKTSLKNRINSIEPDSLNNFWVSTQHGLSYFNTKSNLFTTYTHNPEDVNTISSNTVNCTQQNSDGTIWAGTNEGLDLLDIKTGTVKHFKINPVNNVQSVINNSQNAVLSILKDKSGNIWIGNGFGLYKFDPETARIKELMRKHLFGGRIIFEDSKNRIWAGTNYGLFVKNSNTTDFEQFNDETGIIKNTVSVYGIAEDKENLLWLDSESGFIRLNPENGNAVLFGQSWGVNPDLLTSYGYTSSQGEIYFGTATGYFHFFPDDFKQPAEDLTSIYLSKFFLNNKQVLPGTNEILPQPLSQMKEFTLNYLQNSFTIEYNNIDYLTSESEKNVLYKLENFDKAWRKNKSDNQALYYNMQPGKYVFKVKASNLYGNWTEKSLSIVINPPWYRTMLAYFIYFILLVFAGWNVHLFQKRRTIRMVKEQVRERELEQAKEIEKAYTELGKSHETLKSTQAQLIQSEKMASLGELTAGIAHEIQNPLNFVNNFSEVNSELVGELKSERSKMKGERDETLEGELLDDIAQNTEKIKHHGTRASDIVKGMLQHSRTSSGVKEPTDINALADEYLRLAYHGLRAKDKSFNADFKTDLDETLPKINVIPQDIGRVLLNLINNAFYAAPLPPKGGFKDPNYVHKPTVIIKTSFIPPSGGQRGACLVSVIDNGPGIPSEIKDKIFQPFFTTKPTGQGTGLGLSLSYDIVKAHGGEVKVKTKEGEGSEFIITLPVT
jgi:signal transduction histidine kinase/ligand-binding sensor domain-containing protein